MALEAVGDIKIDARDGFHTDYVIINRYAADPSIFMLPITSEAGFEGQNAAFVQLAAETLTLLCDWTASRGGDRPTVPDPNLLNPDWVLLMKMPETYIIGLSPDGITPVYRISGTYVYGKKNTSTDTYSQVTYPRGPWLTPGDPRNIPQEFAEKGLIDESAGGVGNTTQQLTGYITG